MRPSELIPACACPRSMASALAPTAHHQAATARAFGWGPTVTNPELAQREPHILTSIEAVNATSAERHAATECCKAAHGRAKSLVDDRPRTARAHRQGRDRHRREQR